ncbi:hypothetical protein IIB49_02305 [Patescibacteria group bacterium]|nr:hypothetical protein [Patescibacteria group bacterium]
MKNEQKEPGDNLEEEEERGAKLVEEKKDKKDKKSGSGKTESNPKN